MLEWSHHGRRTTAADLGGEGPTICAIHGHGGDHRVWSGLYALREEYRIVCPDLSGHGNSEDIDADAGFGTLAAYTDDVAVAAEAVDPTVIIGNGIGGAVVLQACLDDVVDPEAMVLMGTGAYLPVLTDLLGWLETDFETALSFLHEPKTLLSSVNSRGAELSMAMMRHSGRSVTYRDFLTGHRFDRRGRLDAIDVPTLVLAGENDRLTPYQYHEDLAESLPKATLETVPEAAHLVMLERPEFVCKRILTFLE